MCRGYMLWMMICLLLPAGPAGGSTIFSFNGVGDPVRRIDVRSRGMGGAGRALADGQNFGSANPALLASFDRAGLSSLFFVQRRSMEDSQGQQHVISDGDLGAFQVALPVRKGTVLGLGLEPLTDLDFTLTDSVATGPYPHRLTIDGTGGIQALSVGLGHRVGRLDLGARLDVVIFGTISEVWKKDYNSSIVQDMDGTRLPLLLNTKDQYVRTHRGVLPSFGAIYGLSDRWSAGGAFRLKSTLTQTRILRNFFADLGFEEETETEADVDLPASVGFGIAYRTPYRWLAALDFERTFWKNTGGGRHDTVDLAAGVLYRTGSPDPLSQRRRLELSAGAHYRSLYFATASGSQAAEVGVSFGIALPFQKGGAGKFRYVIEVGKRGDTAEHGASERYIMQTFSFSGWLR